MELDEAIYINHNLTHEAVKVAEEVHLKFSKHLMAQLFRKHVDFIENYESAEKHKIAMNYFRYFKKVLSVNP